MMLILFMVGIALILSLVFVGCYLWSLASGQMDDLETPALRMLKDELIPKGNVERNSDGKKNQ